MTYLAHSLAAAAYLVTALLGWAEHEPSRRGRAAWCLALGALVHGFALYGLHKVDPPVPLESFPASLSLIGWLVAVGFLISLSRTRVAGATAWAGAMAGTGTALGTVGLYLSAPHAEPLRGDMAWSHAHVLLSAAGFALLSLSSLAGLGYLAKERDLKRKRGPSMSLPSLESLDRLEHITLNLGYALLTLAVLTGFAWGAGLGVRVWTWHSIFLLAAWAVFVLPVRLRVLERQKGPRPARSVVVGFCVLAFSYIGIRLIGGV